MEKQNAVIVKNLVKTYAHVEALKEISLNVKKGELFGVIGPDGAGKTSLFRIMSSLLLPDSGEVNVLGIDVTRDYASIRKKMGYMPGRFSLYLDLSIEENINLFASIYDTTLEENYDNIRYIYSQIEPFRKRRAGALSGGMKQKLALCCALVHSPEILFLDEPTTGVDAVSRSEFWEILQMLKKRGMTILVSTPYMDEASLCDRVALMQDGRILSVDTPAKITDAYAYSLLAIKTNEKYNMLSSLRMLEQATLVYPFGENIHVVSDKGKLTSEELIKYLSAQGMENWEIVEVAPDIEDCFIALMNQHVAA
ncbi:ABC transporter ATP-binding protein [Imperialibacter roseus]|uniref:ABC transporter ATP-binding protein n=1 Tax=Imperialibacter roseus TaxID=1324217 RepID=A0ABZ0IPH0_9BACT|nr:ABC transporter ATP-binding protein [Imperialibacter roseus]WOK05452.1 ABC transporter ATP-binding protein [Imperialibacter roseus]